jgi:hypothetical protein
MLRMGCNLSDIIRFVLLILCCSLIGMAETGTQQRSNDAGKGRLIGRIVDIEESVPIRGSFLVIHAENGEGDKSLTVNAKGEYEIELVPGYYDVLAGAVEFSPSCKRVEILAGQQIQFNPKLHADNEHLQQGYLLLRR